MRMATETKAVTASTLIPAPRTHKFILCAESVPWIAIRRGENAASGGRLGASPTALAGVGVVGSGRLHGGPAPALAVALDMAQCNAKQIRGS